MICKYCNQYGFRNNTHFRVHELWCKEKNLKGKRESVKEIWKYIKKNLCKK